MKARKSGFKREAAYGREHRDEIKRGGIANVRRKLMQLNVRVVHKQRFQAVLKPSAVCRQACPLYNARYIQLPDNVRFRQPGHKRLRVR